MALRSPVGATAGFLALISAAVTPVVMLSACAILITGIGTKHAGLSDRVRELAEQYRATPADSHRRPSLLRQLRTFMRRTTLAWLAHCLLYFAAAVFCGTVLTALLAQRQPTWGGPTIGLFILGTALITLALVFEFLELLLAHTTLRWETDDILAEDTPRS